MVSSIMFANPAKTSTAVVGTALTQTPPVAAPVVKRRRRQAALTAAALCAATGILIPSPLSVGGIAFFALRSVGLALIQALLGSRRRCAALQGAVFLARAIPGSPRFARGVAGLAAPLLGTWAYWGAALFAAPAHARTLRFWGRAMCVYSRYRYTKVVVSGLEESEREKIWRSRHVWGGRKVHQMCVELRGSYLKDGQYLGSRLDLVPAEWAAELRCLQDSCGARPWEEIETVLKQSFKVGRASQIFETLDRVPLASATVAQVHRAVLKDGTDCVVKTQYADQERLCTMDLRNLRRIADFLQTRDMSFFDLDAVVSEMELQLPGEFDFVAEAVAMTVIAENLRRAGIHDIVIPRAIPGLVSRRSIVMSFIDGFRVDNVAAMRMFGVSPERVVRIVGRAVGQQLLVDGFTHADLHPGNLMCLRDGRVALIDFGQTKRLSEEWRLSLCDFYRAMGTKNARYIAGAFFGLGIELDIDAPDGMVSLADIPDEIVAIIPTYANGLLDTAPMPDGVDLSPFSASSPLQTVGIRKFPAELLMVVRTLGALRALCSVLDVNDVVMSEVFSSAARKGARTRNDVNAEIRRGKIMGEKLVSSPASPFCQKSNSFWSGLFS